MGGSDGGKGRGDRYRDDRWEDRRNDRGGNKGRGRSRSWEDRRNYGRGDDRDRDYNRNDRDRYDDRDSGKGKGYGKGGKGKDKGGKGDTDDSTRVWIGGCPSDIKDREIRTEFEKFGPIIDVAIKHSTRDTFAFAQYEKVSQARDAIESMDQANCFGGTVKVASANRKGSDDLPPPRRDDDRDRKPAPRDDYRRSPPRDDYRPPRRDDNCRRSPSRGGKGRDKGSGKGGGKGGGKRRSPEQQERHFRSRSPRSPRKQPAGVRVAIENLPRDMEDNELLDIVSDFGRVLSCQLWRNGGSKRGAIEFREAKVAQRAIDELDDRSMQDWHLRLKAYFD